MAVGVFLEGTRVCGLRCVHGEAVLDIGCGVVIDCTGEAEVAALAGCACLPGRMTDGKHQLFSKTRVAVVDEAYLSGRWSTPGQPDRSNAGALTDTLLHAATGPIELHRPAERFRTVFEGVLPGYREGRRIDAVENVVFADFARGRKTEGPVFYAASKLDNLNRDMALESWAQQDFR